MPKRSEPLTPQEMKHCAAILSVLLPMTFEERLTALAIVCRALWDGRLNEQDFLNTGRSD